MSGEKTKATLSWELNTIKVAAKKLLDLNGQRAGEPCMHHDARAPVLSCTCIACRQECAINEAATSLRALVDGAAKEGAA